MCLSVHAHHPSVHMRMCVGVMGSQADIQPASSRQVHGTGNYFWDSQSEKALSKQEESVTEGLSGVNHFHNDMPNATQRKCQSAPNPARRDQH